MKTHGILVSLVAVGLLAGLGNARAEEHFVPKVELTTGVSSLGPNASVNIASNSEISTTDFVLVAQAGYFFTPNWELSFAPTISIDHGGLAGSSSSTFTQMNLLAGPSYNFMEHVQDSVYLTLQAGFSRQSDTGTNSATAFAYSVLVGKRFELFEHISYNPSVGLLHVGTLSGTFASIGGLNWIINPFAISILF